MFDRLGHGNSPDIINIIMTKILHNLQFWGENESIIKETIYVFTDLTLSCSIEKILITLDPVKKIIENHTAQMFPFLNYYANYHHRSIYYATLSRLVLVEGKIESFQAFMKPIVDTLIALNNLQDINNQDAVV